MATQIEVIDRSPLQSALAEIDKLSTEEVERRFAQATLRTAQGLAEMAACVRVLESRGQELSKLKLAILPYLRLIAHGQLLPDAVLNYAANPVLLSAVSRMPIPDQRRLLDSGVVQVAVVEADRSIGSREVDPRALSRHEIARIFGPTGILPPHEQATTPRRRRDRQRKVWADPRTRTLHIANAKVPIAQVMTALAEAAGRQGDLLSDADGPSVGARLTEEERDRMRAACKAMRLDEPEFVRRAILTWLI